MKHILLDAPVLNEQDTTPEKLTNGQKSAEMSVDRPAAKNGGNPAEESAMDRDSLSQLACNLHRLASEDHIVIDRKRNEVIRTDAVTQQMTIYRCLDPVGMGMRPPHLNPPNPPAKVGRPQKRSSAPAATIAPALSKKPKPEIPAMPAPEVQRTRSGRQVRGCMPQPAPVPNVPPVETDSSQLLELLVADLRDKDYRATMPAPKCSAGPPVANPEMASNTRAVPKNSICPGCNKIFLGRRLQRHFVKFPEHMPRTADQQTAAPSLFGLLTAQLQRHSHLSEEQRADLFLHELNDFVEQLQLRSQRLIRNTSGMHFVNARIARVLAIPEGQYALDMSAMESAHAPIPEPEGAVLSNGVSGVGGGARNLVDYTGLSMSLDDTLTDEAAQRLNLSAGGKLLPPSEESLLRNVSDLMQPPVAAAVPATVNHGYDHASDNAVEALTMKETPNTEAILDLNVDFFQFTNPN
ncbi:uncharacterized protein Dana_GF21748 [Drosophila ananassae]|uniref:Uncharacterized protein n=3 Tax=Drosophila ananassae TaxID=7217 RepID=B3N0C9_DROAN|nr:uncharacterized protein LOC6504420 isoform X1 [Drosophila ananassae]XP_014759023.2 uncharacterized protein LOC26513674 isoform X1 [Drosophila ananassae]XP_032308327.1 uncharacterized protein LOC26513674 isoform X1 [Drosophila ananassae]XP_032308328.1 uncharacterized protein LOC26513674 isoform X1 [Drosophila ananassae]XP_032308330.1 uncharacterized protein LOC6504420 isoform X1 [Drosophila ananassae]XP_032308331.1 uncharacterized protein LOC6504420 isoform X1 [Drosophila ananassae]EDV38333